MSCLLTLFFKYIWPLLHPESEDNSPLEEPVFQQRPLWDGLP